MKNERIKYYLFFVILLVLWSSFLFNKVGIISFKPLSGVQEATPRPDFNLKSWMSGDFQTAYNKYQEENIFARNWLIRFINQIRYSLFNETNASKIVVGKDGYLYEQQYIDSYLGSDFIGEDKMKSKLELTLSLQKELKKAGKDLLILLLPGKGVFYPEYLPGFVNNAKRQTTNYECFSKLVKNYGINVIDFQKVFLDRKKSSQYPLMPKCGIHWSYYGMSMAMDSTLKYMETLRGIDMLDYKVLNYYSKPEFQSPDYDLGELINVMCKIPQPELGYPNYEITQDPKKVKPFVLTIGDSFYWNLYYDSLPQRLFSNVQFWYYNSSVYPETFNAPLNVKQLDLKAEINKQDFIVILTTEAGLSNLGYGFIEDACSIFSISVNVSDDLISTYINRIKNDPEWMKGISKKAKENNISEDEQVRIDAEWLIKQEKGDLTERIKWYVNEINNDPEWLEAVKKKAIEKNIPLEKMIMQDAQWSAENETPPQ